MHKNDIFFKYSIVAAFYLASHTAALSRSETYNVAAGRMVRIDVGACGLPMGNRCVISGCQIKLATRPKLGTLTPRAEDRTVPASLRNNPSVGACAGKKTKFLYLIYKSKPGASGMDAFAYTNNTPVGVRRGEININVR